MIFRNKTGSGFFESRYRKTPDPWNFAANAYERNRFSTVIDALSHKRYRRAFEPGCSIGTLTEQLAPLCDHLDASDFSPTAVAHATERCTRFPQVHITCAALSDKTPVGGYDLILLSEIGYYFRLRQWRSTVATLVASMDPGATVLASHWLGHSSDHRIGGDQVHDVLRAEPLLHLEHEQRHPGFRLDRFTRL